MIEAQALVWNDASVDWAGFDQVIVRSCCDYHLRLPEFLAWVSALESRDIELQNSAQLVRWTSDMAGSEKLVVIRVNFGDHKRTVLAEMKRERANPREIEGKQSLFILNLPPRKMAGVVSEAILFDIGYMDGITPVLAMPESAVPNGAGAG